RRRHEAEQLPRFVRERRGDEQHDAAGKRHAGRLDEKRDEDDRQHMADQEVQMRLDEVHVMNLTSPARARRRKSGAPGGGTPPEADGAPPEPTTYFAASRCFLMKAQSFFVISAGPIGFPPMIDSSDSVRPPNFTAYPPQVFLPAIHHLRLGFARISAALQSHSPSPKTKFYVPNALR